MTDKFLTLSKNLTLYYVCVLNEFEDIPILFVCCDENNNFYLCLCSEIRYILHWSIVQCDLNTLSDLINQKIPIYDVFKQKNKLYSVEYDKNDNISYKLQDFCDMNNFNLPKPNVYLQYTPDDAIQCMLDIIEKNRKSELCSNFKDNLNSYYTSNKMIDILNDYFMNINNISISNSISMSNSISISNNQHSTEDCVYKKDNIDLDDIKSPLHTTSCEANSLSSLRCHKCPENNIAVSMSNLIDAFAA